MGKTFNTGYLQNIIQYDGSNNIILPSLIGTGTRIVVAAANGTLSSQTASTTNIAEGTNLYYTDARVATYLSTNTYATQSYVTTAVSNLVDAAPGTLDTLNELAAALGDDPNFATTVATSIGTKQAQLNGTGFVKVSGTTVSYDNSTYLTTSSASSTYVPYTGATSDLVLGANNFSSKRVSVLKSSDGFGGFTSNYLFLQTGSSTTSVGTDGISLLSKPNTRALVINYDIGGTNYGATLDASLLTNSRTFEFPNASGVLALTSNLSAYLPLAGGTLTGPLNGTSSSFTGAFELNTTGTGALGFFGANNTTDKYLRIRNSSGNFEMGTSSTEHYLIGNGAVPLKFYTNGTPRLTIDGSTGAATFSNSVAGTQLNISNVGGKFAGEGGATNYLGIYKDDGTPIFRVVSNGSSAATFSSSVTATGGLISNGGNIGYGGGELGFGVTTSGATSGIYTLATGSPVLYFDHRAIGNTGFWVWRSGTGGATTALTLSNAGAATFGSSVTAQSGVFEKPFATNGTSLVVRQTTAGGNGNQDIGLLVDIQGANDDDRIANFRYYDGSTFTSRMVIKRGGTVGIGTTTPGGFLELSSPNSNSVQMLLVRNYATSATGNFSGAYTAEIRGATSGNLTHGMLVHQNENNSNRRILDITSTFGTVASFVSNGRVGIGTTDPDVTLAVHGQFKIKTTIVDGNENRLFFNPGGAADPAQLYLYNEAQSNTVYLTANGSSYFNGGSFGIGTATPSAKLEVSGNFRLYGGGTNTGYTGDGLWGGTATPNYVGTTGGGGTYAKYANGGIILGYRDNGSGLYSPSYGFEVKSTDGIPVAGRVIEAIYIKDIDNNTTPFVIYNNGALTTSSYAEFNRAGTTSLYLTNRSLSAGDSSGTTGLYMGDAGSGINVITREKQSVNVSRTVIYSEQGYNVQSTGAFFQAGAAYQGNNSTTWAQISDARIKENVRPISNSLDKLLALNPCHFEYKTNLGKTKTGFIAQEFEQVLPGHVIESPVGLEHKEFITEEGETIKSIDADLIPYLVKAIQEQQTLIADLSAKVNALENK